LLMPVYSGRDILQTIAVVVANACIFWM